MKLLDNKKRYRLFPFQSLIYLICFVTIILLLISFLENYIPKTIKGKNISNSYRTKDIKENQLININNHYKMGFKLTNDASNCIWPQDTYFLDNPNTYNNLCSSSNDLIFYKKNYSNDFIWRSKSFVVKPEKANRKRILVIGDSFVWGDGYANMNDIWWRKLQRELVKRGYYNTEVLALGWNGFNTLEEFEYLKAIFKKYNPDIIIWDYVINDPDTGVIKPENTRLENIIKQDIDSGLIKNPDKFLVFLSSLEKKLPNISKQLFKARVKNLEKYQPITDSSNIVYGYENWELALLKGENFKRYKGIVQQISSFAKENPNTKIFFVSLPGWPCREYYGPRFKKITQLYKSNNLNFYDLLPKMENKFGRNNWGYVIWSINPANNHPGVIVTDFYAKQTADILEKDYLQYLPKKYTGQKPNEPFVNDWVPMTFDIKQNGTNLSFDYPIDTEDCLSFPHGYKYVQLNLSYPEKIKKIIMEGQNLSSARLDITYENPKIAPKVYQLGLKKGKMLIWNDFDNKNLVNTIRISCNFKTNNNKKLKLRIITQE